MVHHSQCPLCRSGNITFYLGSEDYFLSSAIFNLWKCSSCSFIFTQDHPDETESAAYYDSPEYISHNDSSSGFADSLYRLVRSIMLKRKTRLAKKSKAQGSGSILDIGSGSGYFAAAMKKEGWKVTGVEINAAIREYSAKRYGLEIYPPSALFTFGNESFDCITLWHVLEHFIDVDSYAKEIHRILKSQGTCIVALPNSASYDALHYKSFWAAWDLPRHLWHFNPETFTLFCNKHGFSVRSIKLLPADVFYISWLSEKYMKTPFSFVRGMFKALFFSIKTVVSVNRGSSLVYVLTKT